MFVLTFPIYKLRINIVKEERLCKRAEQQEN